MGAKAKPEPFACPDCGGERVAGPDGRLVCLLHPFEHQAGRGTSRKDPEQLGYVYLTRRELKEQCPEAWSPVLFRRD